MMSDRSRLSEKLTKTGYDALFRESGSARVRDEVWTNFPQQDFEDLVGDSSAPALARFLSSQILLGKDMTFLSRTDLQSLSEVYVQALLDNYTGDMSDWGFVRGNDDLGVLGGMFLVFGGQSLPRLLELLENGTVVDYRRPSPDFSGFDPRTLQKLRVKDFAALYLSKIENLPIEFKIPFDERDKAIRNLKERLPK